MIRLYQIPIIFLLLISLTGCTRSFNARLELGAQTRTQTFETPGSNTQLEQLTQPITRSDWQTTIFISPIDGILHGPTYLHYRIPKKSASPRNYGLLPNSESAHLNQPTPYCSDWFHTINELGDSIQAITLAGFFRTFRASTPYWSPYAVWKRTPQEQQWSSGQTTQGQQNDN